ncbi:MAG: alpha/beta hydrolase [Chthoniobacterales bacterium]
MTKILRWLMRTLFALLLIALLAGVVVAWNFEQWKKEKLATLDAHSKVVDIASGPIEYTELGAPSAPAVLISHGAPGGYDQAALLGSDLAKNGFRVIAPSRPGFLRTPLSTGLLFDEQADVFAALLDKLGIKQAAVLGFSTGAQVAVRFALRHPDRTSALVLVSPVTTPYQRDPKTEARQILPDAALFKTTGDMGSWLFVEKAKSNPRWILDRVLRTDTTLKDSGLKKLTTFVVNNPAQLAFFRDLVGTQAPLSPRESGTRNDILLVRTLDPVAYENLQPPLLLVRGNADGAAKWTDLKPIKDKLPSAKVVTVKDAGQIVWLGPNAAAMEKAVLDFLKTPPTRRPTPPTPTPTPLPPAEEE